MSVSDKIFKHEREEISTFKLKFKKKLLRFPCFRIGNRWIVTHGFEKIPSKPAWPEFARANQIREEVTSRGK